jgi:hypothetical protein
MIGAFFDAVVAWGGWAWLVRLLALYGVLMLVDQFADWRFRQQRRRDIYRNTRR